jgi:adenylate cyclase
MQYTAMGDAMNIAARLEGANKYLGSAILVSEAVRDAAPDQAYRALGRVAVSGVASGLALYEPLPPGEAEFADNWNAAIAALGNGDDAGEAAWLALEREHPDDPAAAALTARRETIRRGMVHELQSK